MRFWEKPKKEIIRDFEFNDEGKVDARMRINIFTKSGNLTNYVVQLEHLLDNDWKQVIRYNYYHGIVHKDIYDRNGAQTKKTDLNIHDLKEAVAFAVMDISQNYKNYIKAFKDGV